MATRWQPRIAKSNGCGIDWWYCLVDVLQPFLVMRSELQKTIWFLKSQVEDMGRVLQNEGPTVRRCLPFDIGLKPIGLHVQNWERLLLSLGVEIEKPDCSTNMENISVFTSPELRRESLQNISLVLHSLSELDAAVVSRVLNMPMVDLRALGNFFMDLSNIFQRSRQIQITEENRKLWEKNEDILEIVGFKTLNKHQPSFIIYEYTDRASRQYESLQNLLQGIFQNSVLDTLV